MIMISIWIITLALFITSGIQVWNDSRGYRFSNGYFITWALLSITNISVLGHTLVSEVYIALQSLVPSSKISIPLLLIVTGPGFANLVLSFMHRFGSKKTFITELVTPRWLREKNGFKTDHRNVFSTKAPDNS